MVSSLHRNRVARVATCNLCQWALDFDGNLERIKRSIDEARAQGARYRLGPELEIPGYGCEDHFNEIDTEVHSWECIATLLQQGFSDGIVVDVGAPATHKGVRYNCRVFLLDRRVLLIRPKLALANDGNYREPRYFSTWSRRKTLNEYHLPGEIREVTGQTTCPIGDAYIQFTDATLASETCEELFTPAAPHIDLALAGVEIITNGSGSHHQLRKLDTRLELMQNATRKAGGAYLYANQQGCDGGRLYYDGCASVIVNGDVVAQGSQFSVNEVETIVANVDLNQIDGYRGCLSSMRDQASQASLYPVVNVDFCLCDSSNDTVSPSVEPRYLRAEEEIARGPACWLWDYLRRSGAVGFLLPLSGGADSASVAAIVGCMCQMVYEAMHHDAIVASDVMRMCELEDISRIKSSEDLAQHLLTTVYMGTVNSSTETRDRSSRLSAEIGAYHLDVKIDTVVLALTQLFTLVTGKSPRFKVHGGSHPENAALQNIQARIRMVIAFLLAQLMPWARGKHGFLLVLGSGNVDEALRGYLTKYDCSSADLNPIGGVSKHDLRKFLKWAAVALNYPSLAEIESAPPTAELEPLDSDGGVQQTDEVDMGMTYEELSVFGRLRKMSMCGPVSMFCALRDKWRGMEPRVVAEKVKFFFKQYGINRHKVTVLTPSYHAESYSPDDNRFDHRQILYRSSWRWQFDMIDTIIGDAKDFPSSAMR
jgi:NAD+ synthase (glutamine-hydrolysing)